MSDKIKILSTSKKDIASFDNRAWPSEDLAHYGEKIIWIEKKFTFKAVSSGCIIGSACGKFEAGVIYLETLIIDSNFRGKKIGTLLLNKIINWGLKLGAHKIFLFTMLHWEACRFYEKLGFKITGKLSKHYLKRDFVILTKYLDH